MATSKLTSAAIAATILASSSMAIGQQNHSRSSKATDPSALCPCQAGANDRGDSANKPVRTKAASKPPVESAKAKASEPPPVESSSDAAEPTGEVRNVVPETKTMENERRARQARSGEDHEKKEAASAGEVVGRATTTAATTLIQAGQDVTRVLDPPGKFNPIAVSWNPLGLLVGGRVSLNIEYAPVTHHVIIASPHFANASQQTGKGDVGYTNRFTGVGGELGYRYYTGHKGMNGIFVGPSVIGGFYNATLVGEKTSFKNIGVAVDAGIQHIFADHLALGAGAGIEYLFVTKGFGELAMGPSTIASSGLKPRLLAQAGYAF